MYPLGIASCLFDLCIAGKDSRMCHILFPLQGGGKDGTGSRETTDRHAGRVMDFSVSFLLGYIPHAFCRVFGFMRNVSANAACSDIVDKVGDWEVACVREREILGNHKRIYRGVIGNFLK